ncbi:hypothetical protein Q9L58_010938, partial [Maublancomyces gigas]
MPPKGKGIQVQETPKQKQKHQQQQQPQTPLKLAPGVQFTQEKRAEHETNYMTPSRNPQLHRLEPDGSPMINQEDGTPFLTSSQGGEAPEGGGDED